ncbi:hypothetical protein JTB14_014199 [Gonioctena quinquepunctata]|nr:hypothetical protein JTB14_014199 [Gonioctena quinquepunctata]
MAVGIDVQLVSSELNKLKKDDLIKIILNKQLPNTAVSEVLKKFLKNDNSYGNNQCECYNNDIFHDSQENVSQTEQENKNSKLNAEFRKAMAKQDTMKKLTFHLEKRTEEQSEYIDLLKVQLGIAN